MTPAEKIFWEKVRDKKIMGFKFQRQYPLFFDYDGRERFFIADFYCHALKVVIEIDGGIHLSQKEYDKNRDEILQLQLDLKIIRFRNEEVLNHINKVLIQLRKHLEPNPAPSLVREG